MSTFSGLNTAASGLAAARLGMSVIAQNIANQDNVGYSRQRVETSPTAAPAAVNKFTGQPAAGQGVTINGISRAGDSVVDARVRETLAASGFWSVRAQAAAAAETGLREPTSEGLAHQLSQFWAGWQDLSNTPDSTASGAVVLAGAETLTALIGNGYRAVSQQWSDARATAHTIVDQVNDAAGRIADLNRSIRDANAAGTSSNEFVDARNLLAQQVSRMTGATGTVEQDGTMTLRVDGNALVSGTEARQLRISGPDSIEEGRPTTITWSDGKEARVANGELGGSLSVLAPDGVIATLAGDYNRVAQALADTVNTQHRAGVTGDGSPGGDFFTVTGSGPAALNLKLAVATAEELAVAKPGSGALDGSNADAIAQAGEKVGGPSNVWSKTVSALAGTTSAEMGRATRAESSAHAAVSVQASLTGVDVDEEAANLMQLQTQYQASARVMTAIDEALDVLINRTGLVGR